LWHIQRGYDSMGYELIKQVIAIYKPLKIHPLDVGLVSALQLMESWRRDTSETLTLIRDRASKISSAIDIWNTLVDPDLPPKTVYRYGNHTLTFPIGINATDSKADSNVWSGLQLADILAGAVKQWAGWIHYGRRLENNDDK